ncbi:MAG: PQQ-binding-like beta-propeller repeat protein, partial [Cyclobacteriaceae bacterium]|nr:PQQ-binding-like beta-propeller repeat protein [Cyclobacteriaceae bacterium]
MNRKFLLLVFSITLFFGCTQMDSTPDTDHGISRRKTNGGSHAEKEWWHYQGSLSRNQYSSLDMINRENVKDLEVAWVYHTGDINEEDRTQIQCNPLIIGGLLYGTSPKLTCFALDADTGEERWKYIPETSGSFNFSMGVNRGLSYWEEGDDRRIFYMAGHFLYALDAETGEPVRSFGEQGRVNIKTGLGDDAEKHYVNGTSPGVVYKDKIIVGCRVSEDKIAAPGYIRAYNVKTGAREWVFHTIPKPGEYGYWTFPEDAYNRIGGANNWSGMSLDEEHGIVYIPTGSASFDFYGGNRHGRNLFANCILALNADTGERIWHYQTVHHDLWDRDLPAPPNLVTLDYRGKKVLALAQISKSGFVFLFNRITGEPLYPIEEIPVPGTDLRGEQSWPTQPIPLKPAPFARQFITEDDFSGFDPEVRDEALETFSQIKHGQYFIPPSLEGTLIFPGFDGGGEWGGAAVDEETNIMYINSNEMPWIHTMVDLVPEGDQLLASAGKLLYMQHCAICHKPDMQGDGIQYPNIQERRKKYTRQDLKVYISKGRGVMPAFDFLTEEEKDEVVTYVLNPEASGREVSRENISRELQEVPYTHTGYNRWVDKQGNPVIKPPWGQLIALDLNTAEYLWKVPLGELDYLTEKGIPPTGTENYGGPVVTGGGLIFIAAS